MERKPRKWSSVLKQLPSFIPPLKINGLAIDKVTISKRLGIYVSSDLKWDHILTKFNAKAFKTLYFLTCLKRASVEENELLDYYRSVIRSVIEYACPAWSTGITKGQSDSLEQIPKCAIDITAPHLQYKEAITKFNFPTIKDRLDILNSNLF